MLRVWAAVVMVAFGFTGSVVAQSLQTGTITGKVSDNTGARAAGVAVTAVSPVLITARRTTTDGQGGYTFPSLPPGRYAVSFELRGFRKLTRSEVLVNVAAVEGGSRRTTTSTASRRSRCRRRSTRRKSGIRVCT